MKLIIIFIVLSIINVIFSTIRSIVTIKGGKVTASLISGGYFSFYNIMLLYTVADFPMWQKCVITFVCNVIGVWLVKFFEEKARKAKLWKVEATIPAEYTEAVHFDLNNLFIPNNYIPNVGKYSIFKIYCATQADSIRAKNIIDQYGAKYFVSESKVL